MSLVWVGKVWATNDNGYRQNYVPARALAMHVPGCPRHGAEGAGGVVLTGENDTIEANFNACQNVEERDKTAFLREYPERAAQVLALEDYPILKSKIAIVGLDHVGHAGRITSPLACDRDLVDRAMMPIVALG